MIQIRKAQERGHFNHGWLETFHTFSFAEYHDPKHMGFRSLRVINEDVVQAGMGFPTHAHRDMEIITYILEGELEHKDSMGTGSIIRPGDVQKMSAGSGVRHSEFNPSKTQAVHLLQIWILPSEGGIAPNYEQKHFEKTEKLNKLLLVASHKADKNVIRIYQDVNLYASFIEAGKEVSFSGEKVRHIWIQVARGSVQVNDSVLKKSDGAAVTNESILKIKALENSEILLFDLA